MMLGEAWAKNAPFAGLQFRLDRHTDGVVLVPSTRQPFRLEMETEDSPQFATVTIADKERGLSPR